MRIMLLVLASGLLLSLPGAALADLGDPTNTSAAAAAAAPEPMAQPTVPTATQTESQGKGELRLFRPLVKQICHHPVHEGTVLPQQVCLTQHAWDLIRLRAQKNVNDWQMHGYQAAVH